MPPKGAFCLFLMPLSLGAFIYSAWAMTRQIEPFYTWFYNFAWWSYILFVQAFLSYRNGDSVLFSRPHRFLMLLPLSISLWLVFEAFNFRLQNWSYVKLPPRTVLRWLGYTLSFSTVLPAIFTTKSLLDHFGLARHFRHKPFVIPERFHIHLVVLGIFCLLSPLLQPKFFFPAIWLGLIPLLEPFNYRSGAPSFLREWEKGIFGNLYVILLAGLVCGLIWESLNFCAGAKWFYTIPYFGALKIFEMPLLGFLGFPPFAVECYVIVNASFALWDWARENMSADAFRRRRTILICAMVLFDLIMFAGIDHFTVVSFTG